MPGVFREQWEGQCGWRAVSERVSGRKSEVIGDGSLGSSCSYGVPLTSLSLLQSSPIPETATTPELPSETQETPGSALCR